MASTRDVYCGVFNKELGIQSLVIVSFFGKITSCRDSTLLCNTITLVKEAT